MGGRGHVGGVTPADEQLSYGWVPCGPSAGPIQADSLQFGDFRIGRAWSASAEYTLTHAPGWLHAVLIVEGSFTYSVDGTSALASSGSLMLFDGAIPARGTFSEGTARYLWDFSPTVLAHERARLHVRDPLTVPEQPTGALIATANSLLNARAELNAGAGECLALSVEYLLAAVLAEAAGSRTPRKASADDVFVTALQVIERRFRDPNLSRDSLAREVGVSKSRLHAVFSDLGTSPRREIEQRRIAEVDRLSRTGVEDPDELARRAGFSSVRHLQRTMQRRQQDESWGT